jgi:LytS/YehU family sensor histidine kinase
VFDDIHIFHRVLSEQEIEDLYNEPNPNRLKNILAEVLKYGIALLVLGIVVVIILIRNKRNLQKQKEYYELNNKIKELELKVIRNQMNPHFISNSLSAIQHLILTYQVDKAGQYLAMFNFLVRQVLELSDKTYITLEQELDIVQLNIELEQLRFSDTFKFSIHIEPGINPSEVLIPSLIMQPFIENAIWHGLLPMEGYDQQLLINIYKHDAAIYIAIEDNGVGRSNAMASAKQSMGTKLVTDKMESTNRLRNSVDHKLEIVDLFDEQKQPLGTRVIIQLFNYNPEE